MFGVIESRTKSDILAYLGLRGGCAGRKLARILRKSPSQVFKALKSLRHSKIINKFGPPYFFALKPSHPCSTEIISMIYKAYEARPSDYPFLPRIRSERKIDPEAIYEIVALRGPGPAVEKLSDVLRKKYA